MSFAACGCTPYKETGHWSDQWQWGAQRLAPAIAERAHATSAMLKLQLLGTSRKTPCGRERQ